MLHAKKDDDLESQSTDDLEAVIDHLGKGAPVLEEKRWGRAEGGVEKREWWEGRRRNRYIGDSTHGPWAKRRSLEVLMCLFLRLCALV